MAIALSLSSVIVFGEEVGLVFLPNSRYEQVKSLGLFIDNQNTLVFMSGNRAWGALGVDVALLELSQVQFRPQLTAYGSANAGFRFNDRFDTLLTETVDARAGLAVQLEFSPTSRASVGWTHMSGHISDNIQDLELFGPNLGDEMIYFRLVGDFLGNQLRLGATLSPYVGSDPGMKAFNANQFGEWFPFGTPENTHSFKPFAAFGLEEYGSQNVDFTINVVLGMFAGNHFSPEKHSNFRFVLGGYYGADPRLKYMQFLNYRGYFTYVGAMITV